uniref:Uncharacterized protein n=1 Tax=Manihot esculenta TaxID=3983 RepID=A0A2C9U2L2_MANES
MMPLACCCCCPEIGRTKPYFVLLLPTRILTETGSDTNCHGTYNLSPIPCGLSSPNELSQPPTPTSAENDGT